MPRRTRTSRPYVRSGRNPAGSGAARLAHLAGMTDRPTVEALERRQMLFSLTVTADQVDPQTGIGSVRIPVNYFIPNVATSVQIQDPQDPETREEDFNDDALGNVGSQQFLAGSGIRVTHNLAVGADLRVANLLNDAQDQERWLRANLARQGDFVAFQIFDDPQNPARVIRATGVSFQILSDIGGDTTGIDTDRTIVRLRANNQDVAVYTGARLRQAIQAGGDPTRGLGVFAFPLAGEQGISFDQIRIEMLQPPAAGQQPQFRVDNLSFTVASNRFSELLDGRVFSAMAVLSGPVGASATFFDLYGRDMRTGWIGKAGSSEFVIGDANADGVPDFNDGIGRIEFSGTDSRTSFSLIGLEFQTNVQQPPANNEFYDAGDQIAYSLGTQLAGTFDDMEEAGFGFFVVRANQTVDVMGLPPGPGSVVVGSPFVRPLNNYNPAGDAPGALQGDVVTGGFNNPQQGLFVTDGQPMGSVAIHGILFGASQFPSFVDRISVGYQLGSINVAGDVGSMIFGTDAGSFSPDSNTGQATAFSDVYKTNAQINIGRTVGEIAVGGRSLLDVTVVGNLNDPIGAPARDVYTYYEKEYVGGLNPATQDGIRLTQRRMVWENSIFASELSSDLDRATGQGVMYGLRYMRNDSILGAEFVGSASSGVRIKGDLSGRDPTQPEDPADVFAFAADGTQEVVIEATNVGLIRVVDREGRMIAAPGRQVGQGGGAFDGQIRFRPDGAGVYYLVVTDPNLGDPTGFGLAAYSVAITGMAPATLGAFRTGAGGGVATGNTGQGSVNVLSGSVGSIRWGTGTNDVDPIEAINGSSSQAWDTDAAMTIEGGLYSVAGNLYNITSGSDIGGGFNAIGTGTPTVIVGGNLGTLFTGLSPLAGRGAGEGDLDALDLRVGGSISQIIVQGGVGMDQDNEQGDPRAPLGLSIVRVRTGTSGGLGNIGVIRTGFHVAGDTMVVTTSPGSTVGAVLVAQDTYADGDPRSGIYRGQRGLPLVTGGGSDVRFVDTPVIDLLNSVDVYSPLRDDNQIQIVDDGGARVTISLGNAAGGGVELGRVRVIPIDGSQGVAIAAIEVDLTGGLSLNIAANNTGNARGTVGIGRILVTGADAGSSINITGNIGIDVYRTEVASAVFGTISNETPGGDMVAIDAGALTNLRITRGNLGFVEDIAGAPARLAPFYGLVAAPQQQVRGALGFLVGGVGVAIDTDFNGQTFRPVASDNAAAGNAYLDDVGSPIDGYLNGLVVRTGDVQSVEVGGSVGDVLLQGAGATLFQVRANSDNQVAIGGFDGIVGNIYAGSIASVDVGSGLAAPDGSPIANTGIVAANQIGRIFSSRPSGAVISGVVLAANVAPQNVFGVVDGVGEVTLTNGRFDGAYIGAMNFDNFWLSLLYGDDNITAGAIGNITGSRTDMFGSRVSGGQIQRLVLDQGTYDASTLAATVDLEEFRVARITNSTLRGEPNENRDNSISVGRNIGSLVANEDISDVVIDVAGLVRSTLSARNIVRSTVDVDNSVAGFNIRESIKSSELTFGRLPSASIGKSIVSSTISLSGFLDSLNIADSFRNSQLNITGAESGLGSLTARNLISGGISVAGPVNNVSVTNGDLVVDLRTTTTRGNVGTLRASRDVVLDADIEGNLTTIDAGRHIGTSRDKQSIVVKGDLSNATARAGQLYSDLRVGGKISGTVAVSRVPSLPGNDQLGTGSIIAFGSIAGVAVNGDFGGDIISYSGGIQRVTITNGSLLPGRQVSAFAGDLGSLTITAGNLYGNVYAGFDIKSLTVNASADGVFGDVGVNPAFSQFSGYDAFRNQLPVGVGQDDAAQGPRIEAGRNIVNVNVANGSVFESVFRAGRAMQTVRVNGSVSNDGRTSGLGSAFVAGDTINSLTITGSASDVAFIAGATSLGADGRAGGTGSDADVVKSGSIANVTINGDLNRAVVSAGVTPGLDGVYNTGDDLTALGISTIQTFTVRGSVAGGSIYADGLSAAVAGDGRFFKRTDLPSQDPQLDTGGSVGLPVVGTQTFLFGGGDVRVQFAGPGQAFFDTASGRLTLRGTTSGSSLIITSTLASLNNLDIVSSDDASIGTLRVTPGLGTGSDVVIDGNVSTLDLGSVSTNGRITIGGDVTTMRFAALAAGAVSANSIGTLDVAGAFGNAVADVVGEVSVQTTRLNSAAFRGGMRGLLSVDREVGSVSVTGAMDRGNLRAGGKIGTFSAGSVTGSLIASGEAITSVSISGDLTGSTISAGVDVGRDGAFGGIGLSRDEANTGTIGSISINGSLARSSIVAGYLPGGDTFFGTADDAVAPGLSTIGTVTIRGTATGSARFSESYRVGSSGTISRVSVGGVTLTGVIPGTNFGTETLGGVLLPASVDITDINVSSSGGVFTAALAFSQPIDGSTLSPALSIAEIRGSGDVFVRLIEGVDYSIAYDAPSATARVTFNPSVTSRNLPVVPGRPGPGVYRFQLDSSVFRGKSLGTSVDGNGDGFVGEGEVYKVNAIVGDAGDKLVAERVAPAGLPAVDLYDAINLDVLFDDPNSPDTLADANRSFTVRGSIGDHPDTNTTNFRIASDTDLYRVTLQAGQILLLGGLQGAASSAPLYVLGPDGNPLGTLTPDGQTLNAARAEGDATQLPVNDLALAGIGTIDTAFLIRTTGVYTVVVGSSDTIGTPGEISNIETTSGNIGGYSFTFQVFDDGDSGFTAPVDAGDGKGVVTAPAASAFAGNDGIVGTADDLPAVSLGGFVFTRANGADNTPGTSDDVVTGSNGNGIVSTRTGNTTSSTIDGSIGPAGHAGVPTSVFADVDIYHLNGRTPIAPGTRTRITVRLSETGSDLGSNAFVGRTTLDQRTPADLRGAVQFALFDTSNSQDVDDASLVFSPTDFSPNGGTPNTVIASDGTTTYGYDAQGDFFIDFLMPARTGTSDQAGTFAVYLQGVFNTDYKIEVVSDGTTGLQQRRLQNILIEAGGGEVDWLEASGRVTTLEAFNAAALGFTGVVDGTLTTNQYILSRLVSSLNQVFQGSGAGFDVRFSTNPSDFAGQAFSTIYLSSTADPVTLIFDRFDFLNVQNRQGRFVTTQAFGFSQHSDPFNTDLRDEGVVFVPSFGLLGYTPSRTDIDSFAQSLTAAVGRRAGELMGLRLTDAIGAGNTFDFMASDSVSNVPGANAGYTIPGAPRALSGLLDSTRRTDFYLGRQDSRSILDMVLGRI